MRVLRGLTWDHERAIAPLLACTKLWREQTDIDIRWQRRSLQNFESQALGILASQYDLIVIDHPHVGQVLHERCLLPLDIGRYRSKLRALETATVGPSMDSYRFGGHVWALPVDAAAQVQAWRLDRIDSPCGSWEEVMELAQRGQVQLPLRAPHALMCLFTLCGQLGCSPSTKGRLLPPDVATRAYELLVQLTEHCGDACFDMDPISTFEHMAQPLSPIAVVPLIYGYANYAQVAFRAKRIAFANIPAMHGCISGSVLGGTGMAVSASSKHRDHAVDFAYWIANGDTQSGCYAEAGGQPGHAAAWESTSVNDPVLNFYRGTRATLESAWLRPRHNGYLSFQKEGSTRLERGLRAGESAESVITDLNDMYTSLVRTHESG